MEKLEEFRKNEWHYLGLWKQPLFSAYSWVHWADGMFLEKIGIETKSSSIKNPIIANGNFLVNKKCLEDINIQIKERVRKKDRVFLNKLKNVSEEFYRKSNNSIEGIKRCEANNDNFKKFLNAMIGVNSAWYFFAIWAESVEKMTTEIAKKNGVTWEDLFSAFSQKKTLIMKQLESGLRIKKILEKNNLLDNLTEKNISIKLRKYPEIKLMIDRHIKNYAFSGIGNFVGNPLSRKDFLESINDIKKPNDSIKIEKNIPQNLMYYCEINHIFSYYRQYSAEFFSKLSFESRPFLDKVAKKIGINYSELLKLSPVEIMKLLKEGKVITKNIINKRKGDYIHSLNKEKDIIILDKSKIKKFIKLVSHKVDKKEKILRGVSANKGVVRGRAKIILSTGNFSKMKNGDVLVTTMTTPEFVSVMQKSSAIVTDIGGLLCHAAIISREMNIPCIIGTKIATKVLKDGDLVEVDADKGVVKIIK